MHTHLTYLPDPEKELLADGMGETRPKLSEQASFFLMAVCVRYDNSP